MHTWAHMNLYGGTTTSVLYTLRSHRPTAACAPHTHTHKQTHIKSHMYRIDLTAIFTTPVTCVCVRDTHNKGTHALVPI
jgi:hypothetical protein